MQSFTSTVPSRQLQEKLIQALYEVNKKEFSFEEVGNPTIPGCRIIFEFGLADADCFNYIDEEEVKKAIGSACESVFGEHGFLLRYPLLQRRGRKKEAA